MTQLAKYTAWINENVGEDGGYGRCAEVTEAMALAFPELQRRKGFIETPLWVGANIGGCAPPTGKLSIRPLDNFRFAPCFHFRATITRI